MDTAQATRILIDVATRKRSHARQVLGEAVAVMEGTLATAPVKIPPQKEKVTDSKRKIKK